ncbi:MAG: hypothetical protein QOJ31_483, partial [Gaiellales bacterium]|nr:hypothetical protein [Gaiellales bacterium]
QLINTQMLPDATVPHRFRAAGTFQIAAGDAVTTVAVAPDLQPAVVDPGRTVALRWADGPSRARLADVEVLRPGAERWMLLRRDSTAAWAPITPDAGSGVYRFRVRVHRPDGPPSDWSPDASLRVRTSGVATPSWQPLAVLPAFGPGSTFTGAALSPDGTLWLGGSPMVAVSPLGQTRSVRTPINDDFDQSLLGVRGGVWSCNMYGVAHAVGAGPAQVMLGGHCAGITGSAGDVWALFVDTHPERVAHWHDGRWTTYRPAGVHGYLSSISSDGKGGLWAVGSRIWRFDGGRWRTMPGPAPGTSFMQVKAFAHSAILIGAAPGPEAPVMYRWDGRRWSVIRTYAWPQIVASSIRDVWVDFDHWDGRSWTTEPVAAMAEQANGRMVAYDRGQRTRLLQATPMHLGDDGFAIDRAWVVQGATTFWRVAPAATRGHRLIDASGLGLFDPGIHGPGSMVLLRFPAAGTYHVADSVSERVATVQVGIRVLDGRLGLASGTLPAGAGIDVQMQARGMAAFADWISDGSDPTVALPTAPGTYAFRSRLRDPATGAATGWSPVRTVTVV